MRLDRPRRRRAPASRGGHPGDDRPRATRRGGAPSATGLLVRLHPGVARLVGTATSVEQRDHRCGIGGRITVRWPPTAHRRSCGELLGLTDDPVDVIVLDRRGPAQPHRASASTGRRDTSPISSPQRQTNIRCTNIVRTLCDLGAVDPAGVVDGGRSRARRATARTLGTLEVALLVACPSWPEWRHRAALRRSTRGRSTPAQPTRSSNGRCTRWSPGIGLPPVEFHKVDRGMGGRLLGRRDADRARVRRLGHPRTASTTSSSATVDATCRTDRRRMDRRAVHLSSRHAALRPGPPNASGRCSTAGNTRSDAERSRARHDRLWARFRSVDERNRARRSACTTGGSREGGDAGVDDDEAVGDEVGEDPLVELAASAARADQLRQHPAAGLAVAALEARLPAADARRPDRRIRRRPALSSPPARPTSTGHSAQTGVGRHVVAPRSIRIWFHAQPSPRGTSASAAAWAPLRRQPRSGRAGEHTGDVGVDDRHVAFVREREHGAGGVRHRSPGARAGRRASRARRRRGDRRSPRAARCRLRARRG